jgi:hypothetical protein
MGTQGLRTSAPTERGAAAKSRRLRLVVVTSSLMLPALAGCSSNSPWSTSSWSSNPPPSQTAAVAPPPNSMAPAAQPAYAPPPAPATAAAPPPQQANVGSLTDSYVGFLEMFRDHPQPSPAPTPPPPQYSAATAPPPPPLQYSAATTPGQSAAAKPAGYASNSPSVPQPAQPKTASPSSYAQDTPAAPPSSYAPKPAQADDPRNKVYPTVSILDLFKEGTPGYASAPNVPHPPSTYTPSGQPYSPSSGQAAVATAAPAAQPSDADPAASAYPRESLVDLFKRSAQDSQ